MCLFDRFRRLARLSRTEREFDAGADILYKLDLWRKDDVGHRTARDDDMGKSSGPTSEAMEFLVEGFPVLSNSAREFVRDHPREARLAVVVALETAAQCGAEDDGDAIDVPDALRPFMVRRPGGEDVLGVSEAASRLRVSRTTIYDWVEKGTLIAWKSTKRGLSIPAAQILGPGRVVSRLSEVVDAIGDPELAWSFLTQEWPFDDMAATPLELLNTGRIEEVVDAAPGFGATFS